MLLKLLFLSIFSLLFSLVILPTLSYAQTQPTATPSAQQQIIITPQSPIYANLIVFNLAHTFTCIAVGSSVIGQPCVDYLQLASPSGALSSTIPVVSSVNLSGGILGSMRSILGAVYSNPPTTVGEYLAGVTEDIGIKPAYAQVGGSGNNVLKPVLGLWQASRNISYVIMIVIFIAIGLMIMFRTHLNPQTVISVQMALPGLVIGLVLITFSYLFASFITDIAFVGSDVIGYYFLLAQPDKVGQRSELLQNLHDQNILTIFTSFIVFDPGDLASGIEPAYNALHGFPRTVVDAALTFTAYQYGQTFGTSVSTPVITPLCAAAGVVVGALAGAGAGTATGGVGLVAALPAGAATAGACLSLSSMATGLLGGGGGVGAALINPAYTIAVGISVILIAILLYAMFRLLFRLVSNYLNIIFLTISAPFHFLIASVPGNQNVAVDWVRNMLCNVLAFPAVLALFYFVALLLGGNQSPIFKVGSGIDFTSDGTLPLFGGIDSKFMRFLLAYGALIASPAIPDIICDAVGRVGKYGQIIGQEFQKSTAGGQGYLGRATGALGGGAAVLGGRVTEFGKTPFEKIPGLGGAGKKTV